MRVRRERWEKTANGVGGLWLLTFNDMMTLLLTFFVLILSMSRVDFSRVEAASNAVGSAFGLPGMEEKTEVRVFDPFIFFTPGADDGIGRQGVEAAKNDDGRDRFLERRDAFIVRYGGRSGMTAKATPLGMRVFMENRILFADGGTEFRTATPGELGDLRALIEGTRPYIRVTVGTDETPAVRTRFPSGWELAAARAAQVAEFLSSQGGSERSRISVSAYGAMKSKTLKSGWLGNRGVEVALTFQDQ